MSTCESGSHLALLHTFAKGPQPAFYLTFHTLYTKAPQMYIPISVQRSLSTN